MNRKEAAKFKKELNGKKIIEVSFLYTGDSNKIEITDDIGYMDYDSDCLIYVEEYIDANTDNSKPISIIKSLFPDVKKMFRYAMTLDGTYRVFGKELLSDGWNIVDEHNGKITLDLSCKYILCVDKNVSIDVLDGIVIENFRVFV